MKNEKSLKDTIYNAILEDIFSLEFGSFPLPDKLSRSTLLNIKSRLIPISTKLNQPDTN